MRKLKILVVDDSTYNLFVMQMILEEVKDMQLEIVTALNGRIAVDTVTQHSAAPFDIVFLDLQMPVMDGYDVSNCTPLIVRKAAKRLRELAAEGTINFGRTKIVALSATTEDQFRKQGSPHFDSFSKHYHFLLYLVTKPVSFDSIKEQLLSSH